jgi:hypothetical protein
VHLVGNQDNIPPEGRGAPPTSSYPAPPPPGGYPAWGPGAYAPAPPPPPPESPKKRSVGKKIVGALVAVVLVIVVIALKVGLRAGITQAVHSIDHHVDHPSNSGFDYAIGTCLNVSTSASYVKPSDVQVEPCSSPTALAKVAKKYNGTKNCPNDHYGTLQGVDSGFCLQDNLTVGDCYQQAIITHMFAQTACTPGLGAIDQTVKVALRRDGVDDPGLCNADQQPLDFPEPPLTYCLEVVQRDQ